MTDPSVSRYVYVTYIRTTPERLWSALTDPEFMRRYWFDMHQESEWQPGASWKMLFADGRVADAGEVVEVDPPRRLVLSWRNEFRPELKAEGPTRCVYELEPVAGTGTVKLTVTHSADRPDAKTIQAVSGGWPLILSNLKSLLETGEVILKEHPGRR
jgi:uncharacterized protein YndB with AHSA1/START domain